MFNRILLHFRQIFQHCSFLKEYANDVDLILEKWKEFKSGIPTYGAILLDKSMDYVLLVQGYHAKASWGFPKGKVYQFNDDIADRKIDVLFEFQANEEELPHKCAIREVKEETGFDITPLIDEGEYLERHYVDQLNRLYIVPGIPRDFNFKPITRNEIKECRWFSLDILPSSKVDNSKMDLGIYPNNFYMVFPYVDQLKRWVSNRRGDASDRQYQAYFDQRRQNRSSPRVRSTSHSSPTFYGGDLNKHHQNQNHSSTSCEKQSKHGSSSKQQQQQKKNKKISTGCKQKLDFDASGDSKISTALKYDSPKVKQHVKNGGRHVDLSFNAIRTFEIQPSKAWQHFKFNWEPIFAGM